MHPISSPEHNPGRKRAFCSSEPLTARLFTVNCACARYARQKPGSEYDNSSLTIAAAVASIPAPPYSSEMVMPSSPYSPSCLNRFKLNFSSRSWAKACGSTSSRTKSRTISRIIACSSVGLAISKVFQSSMDRGAVHYTSKLPVESNLIQCSYRNSNPGRWIESPP